MRAACVVAGLALVIAVGCDSVQFAKLNPVARATTEPAASTSPSPMPALSRSPIPATARPVAGGGVPAQPCGTLRLVSFRAYQDRPLDLLASWSVRGGCGAARGWIDYEILPSRMVDPGLEIMDWAGQAHVPVGTGVCQPPSTQLIVQLSLQDQGNGHQISASTPATLYC